MKLIMLKCDKSILHINSSTTVQVGALWTCIINYFHFIILKMWNLRNRDICQSHRTNGRDKFLSQIVLFPEHPYGNHCALMIICKPREILEKPNKGTVTVTESSHQALNISLCDRQRATCFCRCVLFTPRNKVLHCFQVGKLGLPQQKKRTSLCPHNEE